MIRIISTERFLDAAAGIPLPQRDKLGMLLELLEQDPFHSKLHTKSLHGDLSEPVAGQETF